MKTLLCNHIRGVLKTCGLLPGAMRSVPFDRKVEILLQDRSDVAPKVRPLLVASRQPHEQTTDFDREIRVLVRSNSACRFLAGVPSIGVLSALACVSTLEDPARFSQSRSVRVHRGLTPRRYHSREVDRSGHISRCDDSLARTLVYEAAFVTMTGQESFGIEGSGAGDRQTIGHRQSTGGAGQKARCHPAWRLAIGKAVPLLGARHLRLTTVVASFIRKRMQV
jgi:transposase